jgi:hypothetical protein
MTCGSQKLLPFVNNSRTGNEREAEGTRAVREVTFCNSLCREQLKQFLFVHLFGMYYVPEICALCRL